MNLLLLEPGELDAAGLASLPGRRARHVREVLGARVGSRLRAGVVDGPLGEAEVLADDDQGLRLRFAACAPAPPRPRVDLLLALPRPKVLRRLLAPLAALGVGRLLLTNAWKVERDYFDTHVLSPEALGAELRLGLEQARDTRLPRVSVHKHLRALVEDELEGLCPGALRLVADPAAGQRLRAAVAAAPARTGQAGVLLAVGPEGGWIERELGLLERHGFLRVGLGPRPQRTDVACLALVALAHDALAAG